MLLGLLTNTIHITNLSCRTATPHSHVLATNVDSASLYDKVNDIGFIGHTFYLKEGIV